MKPISDQAVIATEKKALGIDDGKPTLGIALSSGGIRSASFGLGILQALLENHILQRDDYLFINLGL
ncbi:MAG: hypothetical protein RBT11_14860 [Desulfobacterales bacterium]|jgi:hypothetical protein|nr:hypothetical protein [Desulfobacterales bacterium]